MEDLAPPTAMKSKVVTTSNFEPRSDRLTGKESRVSLPSYRA